MPTITEPRGAEFELDPGKAPRRHVVTDVVTAPLHTISLLVRNKPGVLVRVSLVFSRRGYNMESLVVSPALSIAGLGAAPGEFSRMTITCSGDPDTLEQIIKQFEKLVDVVHAIDHTGQPVIESELALVKIKAGLRERTELLQIAENFKAKVVDFGAESLIMRCASETEKLDAFVNLLKPFGIIELVRSGKILMARGLDAT
ncbi:MAG TPA: acetolactate synthase small subunit [Vicinamibacterales bacterium]|nr:acetolactate synthase small subunit [Vicinamibacterales bacterium]